MVPNRLMISETSIESLKSTNEYQFIAVLIGLFFGAVKAKDYWAKEVVKDGAPGYDKRASVIYDILFACLYIGAVVQSWTKMWGLGMTLCCLSLLPLVIGFNLQSAKLTRNNVSSLAAEAAGVAILFSFLVWMALKDDQSKIITGLIRENEVLINALKK